MEPLFGRFVLHLLDDFLVAVPLAVVWVIAQREGVVANVPAPDLIALGFFLAVLRHLVADIQLAGKALTRVTLCNCVDELGHS